MSEADKQRRATMRKEWTDRVYREVKASDPEAYRIVVESADGIAINHADKIVMTNEQQIALGSDIEAALMSLAHRLLTRRERGEEKK